MATHVGIGFSAESNTLQAARDAAFQAKTQTKQKIIDLAIVFLTPHYNPLEILRVIKQILPETKVIGCSTGGIFLAQTVETRGIAVLAVSSDDCKFSVGCVNDLSSVDMRVAGAELARTTVMDFGQNRRGAFIIFSDGMLQNNTLMIKGVQEIFGRVFPVLGAGSSDNFQFKETYQLCQDRSYTQSAAALLMGGQIKVSFGNRHGFKPLGKPRFATKVEGNTIKTIDHKRASSLYEDYTGLSLEELRLQKSGSLTMLYPLGIYIEGEKEYLLRTITHINPDGSLTAQGDIPEESEVHLMISNKDFSRQAAMDAAHEALEMLAGKSPKLAIIFESMSRQKLIGRSIGQEIQMIREILGVATPIIGIYSYGEIVPLKSAEHMGEACLQNGTILILTMG